MDKYRRIFQDIPLPSIIIGSGNSIEDMNDAFIALCPSQEQIARLLNSLETDLHTFSLAEEHTKTLEKTVNAEDFGKKIFRVRLSRVKLDDGTTHVIIMLTDITERRRQMEETGRLASIVDSSDDAIISVSFDRKIMSWNHGAERIYGYPAVSMLNGSIMRLVPSSVADDFSSMLSSVAQGNSFLRQETIHQAAYGNLLPVSMTMSPLRYFDEIIGATMICRDISARRQTEEELKTSHRKLKSLMYETVESLSTAHEKETYTLPGINSMCPL